MRNSRIRQTPPPNNSQPTTTKPAHAMSTPKKQQQHQHQQQQGVTDDQRPPRASSDNRETSPASSTATAATTSHDDMDDWVEAELRQVTDRMHADSPNHHHHHHAAAAAAATGHAAYAGAATAAADGSAGGNAAQWTEAHATDEEDNDDDDDDDDEFADASDELRVDPNAPVTALLQTPNVWAARAANRRAVREEADKKDKRKGDAPSGKQQKAHGAPDSTALSEKILQLREERRRTGGSPAMSQREHLLTSPFAHLNREERMERVVKQVHFYFGDRNYPTDKFLRKHAKKSDNGWIPLSVVCTYKKMKKITDDVPLMAEALQNSDVVEVNPEGTAIRRRNPPPKYHPEAICAATVVVTFVNPEHTDYAHAEETVTSILNPFGRIVQIRKVEKPADIPDEVTHFFRKMMNMNVPPMVLNPSKGPRFLVEFDYADEALDAATEQEARASVFSRTLKNLHIALLYKRRKQRAGGRGSGRSSAVQTPMSAASTSVSRAHTPVMFHQSPHRGQQHQPHGSRPVHTLMATPPGSTGAAAGGGTMGGGRRTRSPTRHTGRARSSSLDNNMARAMRQQMHEAGLSSPYTATASSQRDRSRQTSRTPDPSHMRQRANTLDTPSPRRNSQQKRSPLGKSSTVQDGGNWRGRSTDVMAHSGANGSASKRNASPGARPRSGSLKSNTGPSPLKFPQGMAKGGSAEKLISTNAPRASESPSWRSRSHSASPLPTSNLSLIQTPPASAHGVNNSVNSWRSQTSTPTPRPAPVSGRSTPAMGAIKRLPLGPDGSRGFNLKRTPTN